MTNTDTSFTDTSFAPCDKAELLRQIGSMQILSISGGRVLHRETGVTLPVGRGYSVTVDLAPSDTYTVRRVFTRAGKVWIKGEETEVYCDQLGDSAYRASCFVNVDFGESGYTIAAPASGTRPAVVIAQVRRMSL